MAEARRVYGVRSRTGETERLRFCCDFETEEQFSDRFDVFRIAVDPVDFKEVTDPFLVRLVEQSQAKDWEFFRFRAPSRETDTEIIFSCRKQLAILDEFEEQRRSSAAADSEELMAICERKVVERALSVEGAVAKFLNGRFRSECHRQK